MYNDFTVASNGLREWFISRRGPQLVQNGSVHDGSLPPAFIFILILPADGSFVIIPGWRNDRRAR
jgi:hypothetical protein